VDLDEKCLLMDDVVAVVGLGEEEMVKASVTVVKKRIVMVQQQSSSVFLVDAMVIDVFE